MTAILSMYWDIIKFMGSFGLEIVVAVLVIGIIIFGISGLMKSIFPDFWARMEEKQRQRNKINGLG